jgi:hypothetical protein
MTRRMLLLVAVLMGLTALVATLAPPERVRRGPLERATPTAETAQPRATLTAGPDVTATLSTNPDHKPRTLRAELGDQVTIVVNSEVADSVSLGDLDLQPTEPGLPARFELLADTPGSYPLVAVSDEHRIGTLEIR